MEKIEKIAKLMEAKDHFEKLDKIEDTIQDIFKLKVKFVEYTEDMFTDLFSDNSEEIAVGKSNQHEADVILVELSKKYLELGELAESVGSWMGTFAEMCLENEREEDE